MSDNNLKQFLHALNASLTNLAEPSVSTDKFGIIHSYKDGVIAARGLHEVAMGAVLSVPDAGVKALVLNVEKEIVYAVVLAATGTIKEGLPVQLIANKLNLQVSESLLGRVVNALGEAADGGKVINSGTSYAHEKLAPGVMTREPVTVPMATGILAIDALIPIGRGQRQLIIGDRQIGKSTIALDTIINQRGKDVICIYVAIGQREAKVARVYETLQKHDALDYTIIVSAPASTSSALQFLAPYAGTAIAEYFLEKGKDVLIVYDDLSKHAVAYREMSLLLRRPPGREAYPGDVFYLHSRLLERACRLDEENGGGSITALPIIETLAGDVSAYIPTNVISITDGQIFLDNNLFNKGIRPAINIGISVSRVGGAAQTKIMKKVAGKIKLELAQYYELEAFSQFASELEESSKKQLARGRRIIEVMKQKKHQPYALWQQVTLLYAVLNGYLDKYPPEEIESASQRLLASMDIQNVSLIEAIGNIKELTPQIEDELKKALTHLL